MDLLARREHSRAELSRKLAGKDYDPAEIDGALAGLAEEGLQSDARFAEQFVAARAGRGHGPIRIRNDLEAAGVEAAVIEAAMEDCAVDWRARARDVMDKRFGTMPPADYADKARRMRFLSQRGFGLDEIRFAVGELDE